MKYFITSTIIALLLISSPAAAREYQVGVSPPFLNLGEAHPGETLSEKFFIVTGSRDKMLVTVETRPVQVAFFQRALWEHMLSTLSEEDATGWIQLINNPIVLDPAERQPDTGGAVTAYRQINFLLAIPESAEPGWHLVTLRPAPYVSRESRTGADLVAITAIPLLFQISGNAVRSGKALDVTVNRFQGDLVLFDVHFTNTGTVTISTQATKMEFKDGETLVAETTSNVDAVKPGATVRLLASTGFSQFQAGKTYDVFVNVTYTTGSDAIRTRFTMPQVTGRVVAVPLEEQPSLWFLILIPIILIILFLVYRRKKEES